MTPSKVKFTKNAAIKEVSKEEANAISLVYPTNNELLLERPKKIKNNLYEIRMKRLVSLNDMSKSRLKELKFNERSKKMLQNQLKRLHNSGRTHSDLKANNKSAKLEKKSWWSNEANFS